MLAFSATDDAIDVGSETWAASGAGPVTNGDYQPALRREKRRERRHRQALLARPKMLPDTDRQDEIERPLMRADPAENRQRVIHPCDVREAMEVLARAAKLRHRLDRDHIAATGREPRGVASRARSDIEDAARAVRQQRAHPSKDILRPKGFVARDQLAGIARIAGKDVRAAHCVLPPRRQPHDGAAGGRFPPIPDIGALG